MYKINIKKKLDNWNYFSLIALKKLILHFFCSSLDPRINFRTNIGLKRDGSLKLTVYKINIRKKLDNWNYCSFWKILVIISHNIRGISLREKQVPLKLWLNETQYVVILIQELHMTKSKHLKAFQHVYLEYHVTCSLCTCSIGSALIIIILLIWSWISILLPIILIHPHFWRHYIYIFRQLHEQLLVVIFIVHPIFKESKWT